VSGKTYEKAKAVVAGRVTPRSLPAGILADMDDLLEALHVLPPLWLPSLVLSLAAGAGLAPLAWG
jgi:hypothetical protein